MTILYYKTYKMSRSLFFFLKKFNFRKDDNTGNAFLSFWSFFFYKDDSIILFPFQL